MYCYTSKARIIKPETWNASLKSGMVVTPLLIADNIEFEISPIIYHVSGKLQVPDESFCANAQAKSLNLSARPNRNSAPWGKTSPETFISGAERPMP
jgi:hypothetical protein